MAESAAPDRRMGWLFRVVVRRHFMKSVWPRASRWVEYGEADGALVPDWMVVEYICWFQHPANSVWVFEEMARLVNGALAWMLVF